jgi:hypothetical protein
MKSSILVIVALMATCISANAIETTNGPYTISFNDTLLGNLTIHMEHESTETLEGIPFNMYVTLCENQDDKNTGVSFFIVDSLPYNEAFFNRDEKNEVHPRVIDGFKGHIYQREDNRYVAYYALDDNTGIEIFSGYGWDERTISILKSIHVTKKDSS